MLSTRELRKAWRRSLPRTRRRNRHARLGGSNLHEHFAHWFIRTARLQALLEAKAQADGRLTAMKALGEEREQLRTALGQHKAALDATEAEAAQLKAHVAGQAEHVQRLEAQLAIVQQANEQQSAEEEQLKVAERAHADEMAGLQGEVARVREMMEIHRAEAQRLKDHVCGPLLYRRKVLRLNVALFVAEWCSGESERTVAVSLRPGMLEEYIDLHCAVWCK